MDEIVQFDFPTDSPKIIKVIGVGGGGGNAVNHMYREGIHDVTFVLCNTDNQALAESPVPVKLQLGRSITQGLGAGNRPERARDAAEESIEDIRNQLNDGTKMVFITAGMGGFIDKYIPKVLRLVFTPMVVMIIMVPLTLIGIAPLASYISKGLVMVVSFLYDLSPIIAGIIVGGTRLLVVLTGMHLSLGAICIENLNQFGWDFLLPMNTMGTLALFGVCLGVWVRSKNSQTKSIGASTAISAFIGITEPGIYGVILKFKNALISAMIAGACGGAIVGAFGGRATAYVNSCILSLPVFMTDGFWAVCLGMAVSAVVGFVLVMILGLNEDKEETKQETKTESKFIEDDANTVVYSPMKGELLSLTKVNDEVFASGSMGKGVAINPTDGKVVAPFDGKVTMVYPTKHAIGLTSNTGVEIVVHVGMNTANLHGQYFDVKVENGQEVKKGDLLMEVDLTNILKEGYSLITPIVVTNSKEYLDVLPNEESGNITQNDALLTVLK